jgi:hypothetical protein
MSRKILFIIAIIIVIIIFVVSFINTRSENSQNRGQNTQQGMVSPTLPPSVPQTVFQLFPNPAQPDSQGNIDINVAMNTNNNRATAAQFTIQYDPASLKFVSIHPDDAFYNAKVVTQNVNETSGIITYSMELPSQAKYKSIRGDYHIAEMEFTAKHQGTTTVKVVSASVTSPDSADSVLKSIAGTAVKLNN